MLQMLFGGRSSDTTYYNDIWSWDGREWTVQSPDSLKRGPQPRDHSSMAYNDGQLIVWGESEPFDPVSSKRLATSLGVVSCPSVT